MKTCPYCYKEIDAFATRCPYCTSNLPSLTQIIDELDKDKPEEVKKLERNCTNDQYNYDANAWKKGIPIGLLIVSVLVGLMFLTCPSCMVQAIRELPMPYLFWVVAVVAGLALGLMIVTPIVSSVGKKRIGKKYDAQIAEIMSKIRK